MDWKSGLIILQTLVIFGNILIFAVIKFNDLKHLTEDVSEITKNIKGVFRRLGKVEKAVIKRDAICEERHNKK